MRGVVPARYVGKEANRVDDRVHGLIDDISDYRTEYLDPTDRIWRELVVPVLADMPRQIIIDRTGLDRRSVERIVLHGAYPHPNNRAVLVDLAVGHATAGLRIRGIAVPREPAGVLQRWLNARGE